MICFDVYRMRAATTSKLVDTRTVCIVRVTPVHCSSADHRSTSGHSPPPFEFPLGGGYKTDQTFPSLFRKYKSTSGPVCVLSTSRVCFLCFKSVAYYTWSVCCLEFRLQSAVFVCVFLFRSKDACYLRQGYIHLKFPGGLHFRTSVPHAKSTLKGNTTLNELHEKLWCNGITGI